MTPSTTGTGPRSVRSISAHSLVRGHHLSWRRARPAQGLDLSAESQLIRLRRPLSRRRRIDQRRLIRLIRLKGARLRLPHRVCCCVPVHVGIVRCLDGRPHTNWYIADMEQHVRFVGSLGRIDRNSTSGQRLPCGGNWRSLIIGRRGPRLGKSSRCHHRGGHTQHNGKQRSHHAISSFGHPARLARYPK